MGLFDIISGIKNFLIEEGQRSKKETRENVKKKIKSASDSQLKTMYKKSNGEGKMMIKEEMNKRNI